MRRRFGGTSVSSVEELVTPRAIHGVSRGSDAPTHGGVALSYSPLLSATENILSLVNIGYNYYMIYIYIYIYIL